MSSGHGHAKKAKKHEEEEHENHERWLVSYADMVTLLMCLFIVLFAISQVDTKKFAALSAGLSESFGAPITVLPGTGASRSDASVLDSLDAAVDVQIPSVPAAPSSPSSQETQAAQAQKAAAQEYADLTGIQRQLDQALSAAGYAGKATYQITEDGLVVHIVSDPVLFGPESATLQPDGIRILNAVAPTLAGLPNKLDVQGHANSIPVTPGGPFPSNWELSGARASTVVRYLAGDGVPDARMKATGLSDTQPLVDDSDPHAAQINRRVDIVVQSTASADANALLPGLAGNQGGNP